jgi:hypothetical protein
MNASRKGNDSACDICVYDVRKCFDTLWLAECVNDLFEAGLTNDKLCILYYQNLSASIAVKTPHGTTERFNIQNIVMQGTVWAGLMCTCSMDKLGKQAYGDRNILYQYKGVVQVPPLQMVDVVISASKCGSQVVSTNSAVTTFSKLKKLELSESKCARIHIGKFKCDHCANISVNGKPIKESEKEKYLGDYLTSYASPAATLQDRKCKGYGILGEIRAILNDIPLGSKRLETGLTLRESWFLNGTLYNSEVWCNYGQSDLKELAVLDRKIIRCIIGAHAKSPREMLYLETNLLEIPDIVSMRRLLYYQNVLQKQEDEIVRKVFVAQRNNPSKGDWILLVQEDMEKYNIGLSEPQITSMSMLDFKKLIRKHIRKYSFQELTNLKIAHKKVKYVQHNPSSGPQEYLLSSKLTRKMRSLLYNLRCKSVTGIKENFHRQFKEDLTCPLKCFNEIDTQQHLLHCQGLVPSLKESQKDLLKTVQYSDIFGSIDDQAKVVGIFLDLLRTRKRLLTNQQPAYPGNNSGPRG